ncbi:MAG: ribosome-binding factor A [bacterium]|nr:ribosome-binding factor A [bacterium]
MSHTEDKTKRIIRDSAADFLSREANRYALITVTDVKLKDRGTKATIFITVLPTEYENASLDFTKRKRSDLRDFLKSHVRLRKIPFLDFEIDKGERNRQRIDELSG